VVEEVVVHDRLGIHTRPLLQAYVRLCEMNARVSIEYRGVAIRLYDRDSPHATWSTPMALSRAAVKLKARRGASVRVIAEGPDAPAAAEIVRVVLQRTAPTDEAVIEEMFERR
jgi:phosphotransferase system HPr-like phosphotransfer protein